MGLTVINIGAEAAQLKKPFSMIDLAQVDDLFVSLYLCHGTMPLHRHLDQDELFLVQSGTISLDSDWGTVMLRAGELAMVPKGLSHRSAAMLRSLVLLLQPRVMVNRRNGHRRLFSLPGEAHLEKMSLVAIGRQLSMPFVPVPLAQVDTWVLSLTLCKGAGPRAQAADQSTLVLCTAGRLVLHSEGSQLGLGEWELTVIPKGVPYRLSSEAGALVLGLQRLHHPGPPSGARGERRSAP